MDKFSLDAFIECCQSAIPLELDVVSRREGVVRPKRLNQPFAVVGRDPAVDITLDHPDVSRQHAYLQVIQGRLFCVDLGSRTGVIHRRKRERSAWLSPECGIGLGPYDVRLPGQPTGPIGTDEAEAGPSPVHNPLLSRSMELDDLPEAILDIRDQSRVLSTWPVDRVLILFGSGPNCRFRLKSTSISRVHFALVRTAGGLWAVDLLGRGGGIAVNQRIVRFGRLDDGDEMRVGPFRIDVRAATRTNRATLSALPARQLSAPDSAGPVRLAPLHRPGAIPLPVPSQMNHVPLHPEIVAPSVTISLDQFAEMQRDMFGQFEQLMMSMMQMFAVLNQEQVTQVRGELAELRRLTLELQELKSPPSAPPASSSAHHAESRPEAAPSAPRAEDAGRGGDSGAVEEAAPPTAPGGQNPVSEAETSTDPTGSPRQGTRAPTEGLDEDVHVALSRRIAAIRQEQEGRWQRVVNLMTGRSKAESSD